MSYVTIWKPWRSRLVAAVVFGAVLFVLSPSATAASTPMVYVSDEVFAPTSATSCSGQSRTSAAGIALRTAVAAQDGPWRAAAVADGATSFVLITSPASINPNEVDVQPTPITVPGANLVVGVSKRNVTPAERDSLAPASIGSADAISYRDPYAPAWGTSGSASTLQDCAPRPQWLYDGLALPQPRMWNTVGGDGGTLDASYFEFSRPIDSFGAWFGDIETRTDGEGEAAALKLFDSGGNVVYSGPIGTSTVDQANGCGGAAQGTDQVGCGNQGTRWIGFSGLDAEVASMLVVVGDDDTCNPSLPNSVATACNGLTEHLSWVGATVALRPAELEIKKSTPAGPHAISDQFDYTIDVENVGDQPATSVAVSDSVPSGFDVVSADGVGWTCAVVAQDVTCTHDSDVGAAIAVEPLTITVEVTEAAPLLVVNEVELTYNDGDGIQTASADAPVSRVPASDLSVQKSHVENADGTVTWTVEVANDGPDTAEDVQIVDTFPDGLSTDPVVVAVTGAAWACVEAAPTLKCQLDGPLAAGSTATMSITAAAPPEGGTFENRVTVETSTIDLDSKNDSAEDTVVIDAAPTATDVSTGSPSTSSVSGVAGDDAESADLRSKRLAHTGVSSVAIGAGGLGFLAVGGLLSGGARLVRRRF